MSVTRSQSMPFVAFCAICHLACAADAIATDMDRLLNAAELRMKENRDIFVEWEAQDKIYKGALPAVKSDTGTHSSPPDDSVLRRTHSLAMSGPTWRMDTEGEKMIAPPGREILEVHRSRETYVIRDGKVLDFRHTLDNGDEGRGQMHRVTDPIPQWATDVAILPIGLFAAPLKTPYFQEIKAGKWKRVDDSTMPETRCFSSNNGASRIWFDPEQSWLPVRLRFGSFIDISVTYKRFSGIGRAPYEWTYTRMSRGNPQRVTRATVTRWHRDSKTIASLVRYQFPEGTIITDVDSQQRFVSSGNGRLRPVATVPQGRGWAVTGWIVCTLLVIVVGIYFFRRARCRST